MTAAAKAAMITGPKLFTRPCTIRIPKFMTDCCTQVRMERLHISRRIWPFHRRSVREGRKFLQRIKV